MAEVGVPAGTGPLVTSAETTLRRQSRSSVPAVDLHVDGAGVALLHRGGGVHAQPGTMTKSGSGEDTGCHTAEDESLRTPRSSGGSLVIDPAGDEELDRAEVLTTEGVQRCVLGAGSRFLMPTCRPRGSERY